MKNKILYGATLALLLASCQNENESVVSSTNSSEISIISSVESSFVESSSVVSEETKKIYTKEEVSEMLQTLFAISSDMTLMSSLSVNLTLGLQASFIIDDDSAMQYDIDVLSKINGDMYYLRTKSDISSEKINLSTISSYIYDLGTTSATIYQSEDDINFTKTELTMEELIALFSNTEDGESSGFDLGSFDLSSITLENFSIEELNYDEENDLYLGKISINNFELLGIDEAIIDINLMMVDDYPSLISTKGSLEMNILEQKSLVNYDISITFKDFNNTIIEIPENIIE